MFTRPRDGSSFDMMTASELRELADRCFAVVESTTDERLQHQARSRGYQYLKKAEALEQQEARAVLGSPAYKIGTRLSPLQNVALLQLRRVAVQIRAMEAEPPRMRLARANLLEALCRKRAELERTCGFAAQALREDR
jgi:hypothetical protein